MLNVATRSATPAKTVRKPVKMSRNSALMSSVAWRTSVLPVTDSRPEGSRASMRRTSSSWLTLPSPTMPIAVTSSLPPSRCSWAPASVKAV